MYISFRQSATRREPVLECGRCGALVTDTARHTDWHKALEGGHGAVLSEDQAVEHGLVPDPERTAPPTSSEVAREEERLRRITGRRSLYPFPAPVHAVPEGPGRISPEARWVAGVYAYFGLSDEPERLEPQMALVRDDSAVVEAMRRQGASGAQIAREMELRWAQREQPSDAGIGPQPLIDPVTRHRRTPE